GRPNPSPPSAAARAYLRLLMDWQAWSRDGWRRHAPGIEVDSLGEGTIHGFAHRPGSIALTVGDDSMTFGEVDAMSAGYARTFKRGTIVPLAEPVSAQWIGKYLGILRAGAVALPLNPTYTRIELDRLIAAANAFPVAQDVALIAFTSGTTGAPKAVP